MLENLITSKTRLKLLVKFFINTQTTAYLRNLETEFGESTNAIRIELNRLVEINLLICEKIGNRKYYRANIKNSYFNNIHHLLLKHIGIETIIEEVIKNTKKIEQAYIAGEIARGKESQIIDIILIGNNIDHKELNQRIFEAEKLVSYKIRYIVISKAEMTYYLTDPKSHLLIWTANN